MAARSPVFVLVPSFVEKALVLTSSLFHHWNLQSSEHYAEMGRTHGEEFLPFGTVYHATENRN
jgi:hypothetical protein